MFSAWLKNRFLACKFQRSRLYHSTACFWCCQIRRKAF